jgi:hypothetical protein
MRQSPAMGCNPTGRFRRLLKPEKNQPLKMNERLVSAGGSWGDSTDRPSRSDFVTHPLAGVRETLRH